MDVRSNSKGKLIAYRAARGQFEIVYIFLRCIAKISVFVIGRVIVTIRRDFILCRYAEIDTSAVGIALQSISSAIIRNSVCVTISHRNSGNRQAGHCISDRTYQIILRPNGSSIDCAVGYAGSDLIIR